MRRTLRSLLLCGLAACWTPAYAQQTSGIPPATLSAQAANTVLGNGSSGSAVPTALAVGSCSGASNALIWTTNTGFGCNTITGSSVGTTANTFTRTQTIAESTANETPLIINGGSDTGSGVVVPGITVDTTLNTTGVVHGSTLFLTETDTQTPGAGSTAIEYKVGGTAKFTVDRLGALQAGAISGSTGTFSSTVSGAGYTTAASTNSFGWNSRSKISSTNTTTFGSVSYLQIGDVDGSAPAQQGIISQGCTTSCSANTAGPNFTIQGSRSSGTGLGGPIQFVTSPAGGSGTTVNQGVLALTITGKAHITTGGTAPALTSCGTSPSVVTGTDTAGTFTEGSAGSGCTLTYNIARTAAAHCVVTNESGIVFSYTQNTSGFVITNIGVGSSTVFDYLCIG